MSVRRIMEIQYDTSDAPRRWLEEEGGAAMVWSAIYRCLVVIWAIVAMESNKQAIWVSNGWTKVGLELLTPWGSDSGF